MSGQSHSSIGSIIDDVEEAAEEHGEVSVGQIVESIGHRAFGPLIAVPAILVVSPLGAIPVLPTVLALVVAIFAIQVAIGKDYLWLPTTLSNRSVKGSRVRQAVDRIRPTTRKLDRWFNQRLKMLCGSIGTRIAAACCLLLCLTVPPLELIPLAAALPMAAIALFGIAIALRDGLLMLLAYALMGATLFLLVKTTN